MGSWKYHDLLIISLYQGYVAGVIGDGEGEREKVRKRGTGERERRSFFPLPSAPVFSLTLSHSPCPSSPPPPAPIMPATQARSHLVNYISLFAIYQACSLSNPVGHTPPVTLFSRVLTSFSPGLITTHGGNRG